MIIKDVKLVELNITLATVFLDTQNLKMTLQNTNVYVITNIIKKFDEKLKE